MTPAEKDALFELAREMGGLGEGMKHINVRLDKWEEHSLPICAQHKQEIATLHDKVDDLSKAGGIPQGGTIVYAKWMAHQMLVRAPLVFILGTLAFFYLLLEHPQEVSQWIAMIN